MANANVSESSNTSPDTNYQNVADSLGNLFVVERTFSIILLSLPKDNLCLKLSLFRIQNMLKLLIQPAYFVSFFSEMGTNCVQNRDTLQKSEEIASKMSRTPDFEPKVLTERWLICEFLG